MFVLSTFFLFCLSTNIAIAAFSNIAFRTNHRSKSDLGHATHFVIESLSFQNTAWTISNLNRQPRLYFLLRRLQKASSLSSSFELRTSSSSSQGDSKKHQYPNEIEDWESYHVEQWLVDLGFGHYVEAFASDGDGIGVDGDRLVYLGTPDQLDHIEWQMSCIGVENEEDQLGLSHAIEQLVSEGPIKLGLCNQKTQEDGEVNKESQLSKNHEESYRGDEGNNYQI